MTTRKPVAKATPKKPATRKAPAKKVAVKKPAVKRPVAAKKPAPKKAAPRAKREPKPVKQSYVESIFGTYAPTPEKCRTIAERFILDWNPLEALKAGGYAETTVKSHGYVMIHHPNIRAEIEKLQAEVRERVLVDEIYVIEALHQVVETSLGRRPIFAMDDEGNTAVKISYNSVSAISAAKELGRHLGMFKDVLEVKKEISIEDWIAETEKRLEGRGNAKAH